jgi:tetratricopeptide (TPR) repeat protein
LKPWRAILPAALAVLAGPASAESPGRAEARAAMAEGVDALYRGDARTAAGHLARASLADPGWSLPHAVSARILLELGDGAGASAALARAQAAGMDPAALAHLQAHTQLLAGDTAGAMRTAATARGPALLRAYAARILCRAAMAEGNRPAAQAAIDAAAWLAPRHSAVWADAARFSLWVGDTASAIDAAGLAYSLHPARAETVLLKARMIRIQYGPVASLPWFERAVALDPENREALADHAATLGESGRHRAMLDATRRLLAAEPGHPFALYLQAVMSARAGRYDLARALVLRTGGRIDSLPGMMLLRSVLELEGGAAASAAARLEQLVARQPRNARARRLLVLALMRSGNASAAAAAAGPIVERPDADSYMLTLAGRAEERRGSRALAAAHLDRAARAGLPPPGLFEPLADGGAGILTRARAGAGAAAGDSFVHVAAGDLLDLSGDSDRAVEAYRRSANLHFGEGVALRLVALLMRLGRRDDAVAVLSRFLEQNPRHADALSLAANLALAEQRWPSAVGLLESLRERLGNRDAALLANLATAHDGAGNPALARLLAERAYALAPRNPGTAAVLLRQLERRPDAAAAARRAALQARMRSGATGSAFR